MLFLKIIMLQIYESVMRNMSVQQKPCKNESICTKKLSLEKKKKTYIMLHSSYLMKSIKYHLDIYTFL